MPDIETVLPTDEELYALDRWIERRGILSPLVPDEGSLISFYRTVIEPWETSQHRGSHVTRAVWVRGDGRIIRVWFAMASVTSTTTVVKLADHLDSRTGWTKKSQDNKEKAVVQNILSAWSAKGR